MFAARVSRMAPQVQRFAQQIRNNSVVSGPPTVKISPAEKLAHGLILVLGLTAIPAWVLVNIKHYRAGQ